MAGSKKSPVTKRGRGRRASKTPSAGSSAKVFKRARGAAKVSQTADIVLDEASLGDVQSMAGPSQPPQYSKDDATQGQSARVASSAGGKKAAKSARTAAKGKAKATSAPKSSPEQDADYTCPPKSGARKPRKAKPPAKPRGNKDWPFNHIPPGQEDRRRNGRMEGRNLMIWTRPRMIEKLVLHMQYELARHKIDVPWDAIAHRLHPGSSGSAILQFLNRLRPSIVAEGHLIPPNLPKPGVRAPVDPTIRGYVRKDMDGPDAFTVRPVPFTEPMDDRKFNLPDAFEAINYSLPEASPRPGPSRRNKGKAVTGPVDLDSDADFDPAAKSTVKRAPQLALRAKKAKELYMAEMEDDDEEDSQDEEDDGENEGVDEEDEEEEDEEEEDDGEDVYDDDDGNDDDDDNGDGDVDMMEQDFSDSDGQGPSGSGPFSDEQDAVADDDVEVLDGSAPGASSQSHFTENLPTSHSNQEDFDLTKKEILDDEDKKITCSEYFGDMEQDIDAFGHFAAGQTVNFPSSVSGFVGGDLGNTVLSNATLAEASVNPSTAGLAGLSASPHAFVASAGMLGGAGASALAGGMDGQGYINPACLSAPSGGQGGQADAGRVGSTSILRGGEDPMLGSWE